MPIFRLIPQHLEDPDWQASTYKGEVLVRAADARHARLRTTNRFGIAGTLPLEDGVPRNPWTQERLVTCTQEEGSPYPEAGSTTVLWPEEAAC
jgi:hypothetical protein